jgi:hypothetical protein
MVLKFWNYKSVVCTAGEVNINVSLSSTLLIIAIVKRLIYLYLIQIQSF